MHFQPAVLMCLSYIMHQAKLSHHFTGNDMSGLHLCCTARSCWSSMDQHELYLWLLLVDTSMVHHFAGVMG